MNLILSLILLAISFEIRAQPSDSIPELPNKEIKHTALLVGNTGNATDKKNLELNTLQHLQSIIEQLPEKSSVIFLGDNIMPNGLPGQNEKDREKKAVIARNQLNILEKFKGQAYFMPGNNDWNNSGPHGRDFVRRQEKYLENYFISNQHVKFVPDDGCSGPVVEKVYKNLVFIFIDSEWWLRNNKYNKTENLDCPCKTRNDLLESLRNVFLKNQKDQIILFIHHPLETLGKHSGTYNWQEHIFPIESSIKGAYIPIPVIGSMFPAAKNIFGSKQDMSHPEYQLLKEEILNLLVELKLEIVIASGHDHGLQYFEDKASHFILSGSHDIRHRLKSRNDESFSNNTNGYALIRLYSNGEMWLDFIEIDDKSNEANIIYRTQLHDDEKRLRKADRFDLPKISNSDTTVAANSWYGAGSMNKFWFGNLYRDMWATPVNVPMLDLETMHGGLTPKRLGGGRSTVSLRLEDDNNREYVLRSVDKYYYRALGEEFKDLKLFEVVQDMVGAHCTYGQMILPNLSKAAEIYYTDPKLFYVKKQPGLKGYNQFIEEQMYWLQERTSVDDTPTESFGFAPEIINYRQLMKNLENKKSHFVDQKWVLKSRLFDMWIHDFDRHHDNWRWAVFENGDSTLYRPIPRDRDMAFYNFEGFFPGIVSHFVARILLPFRKDIQDVQYLNDAAINFDNSFLNELTWEDWLPVIERLQERLTDSVIIQSIAQLPVEVQHLVEKDFYEKLIYRRDNLKATAFRYYKLLNKEVVIIATNDEDKILLDYATKGTLRLKHYVSRKKKGDLLKYDRVFNPDITRKIRIFTLDAKDEILVNGDERTDIDIKIIGGHGKDSIVNRSTSHKITLYDYPDDFVSEGPVRTKESNELYQNSYHRKGFEYNTTDYIANLGIVPDDGLWFSVGQIRNIVSWPHRPYKAQHRYSVNFSFATRRFIHLGYHGQYNKLIGNTFDLYTGLTINTPLYSNYFGLGNSSTQNTDDKKFNWVRMNQYQLRTGIEKRWNYDKIRLKAGPFFERRSLSSQEGRVTDSEFQILTDHELNTKHFIGFEGQLSLGYRDSKVNPMDGFELSLNTMATKELANGQMMGYFDVGIHSYIPLLRSPQITIANALKYSLSFGNPEFYQRAQIGHSSGLRGWRNQRFIGDRAFYHNIDLRVHLFTTSNKILPMNVGFVGGYDYGRVWLKEESFKKMHKSISLGLSFEVLQYAVFHPYYSILNERNTFNLSVGYRF